MFLTLSQSPIHSPLFKTIPLHTRAARYTGMASDTESMSDHTPVTPRSPLPTFEEVFGTSWPSTSDSQSDGDDEATFDGDDEAVSSNDSQPSEEHGATLNGELDPGDDGDEPGNESMSSENARSEDGESSAGDDEASGDSEAGDSAETVISDNAQFEAGWTTDSDTDVSSQPDAKRRRLGN